MGRQRLRKPHTRRRTTTLKEIIGTDLLTWKEKLIQGESSGLYSLTNEQAYFKVSSDKAQLSIAEFERKLQSEIDPNFRVVYNAAISSSEHVIQGHSVYFYIPMWDAYIKVLNVGRNGDKVIPAESVGKIVSYQGESFQESGNLDEEAILYRGWVAAFEGCKYAYERWEIDGISPAMCISHKEIYKLKQAFSVIGFKQEFDSAKGEIGNIVDKEVVISANEPIEESQESTEDSVPTETHQEESKEDIGE